MNMNAGWHRVLTVIFTSLTGVSALLSATDPDTLGIGATAWAWTALVLTVATIIVTAVRQAADS